MCGGMRQEHLAASRHREDICGTVASNGCATAAAVWAPIGTGCRSAALWCPMRDTTTPRIGHMQCPMRGVKRRGPGSTGSP